MSSQAFIIFTDVLETICSYNQLLMINLTQTFFSRNGWKMLLMKTWVYLSLMCSSRPTCHWRMSRKRSISGLLWIQSFCYLFLYFYFYFLRKAGFAYLEFCDDKMRELQGVMWFERGNKVKHKNQEEEDKETALKLTFLAN